MIRLINPLESFLLFILMKNIGNNIIYLSNDPWHVLVAFLAIKIF